uniref:Uncharacterized protein n=1 Tax=Arundo donax TaxID=35708 RepID=A0A0A9BEM6_ARUDO
MYCQDKRHANYNCFPLRWMQMSELSNKELQLTVRFAYICGNSYW